MLRPGGRLAILEITTPRGPLKPFYKLWFDVLIPVAGRILPGGKAYTYLPASVRRFPGPEALAALLEGKAFVDTAVRELGMTGFNRVWESPATLPTRAEIKAPLDWVRRIDGTPALTA